MDLLETKVSRVKQGARDCLVCRGKKDLLGRRERKAMEACLASLGLLAFGERGEVLERQASPVQRVRKENPLL